MPTGLSDRDDDSVPPVAAVFSPFFSVPFAAADFRLVFSLPFVARASGAERNRKRARKR